VQEIKREQNRTGGKLTSNEILVRFSLARTLHSFSSFQLFFTVAAGLRPEGQADGMALHFLVGVLEPMVLDPNDVSVLREVVMVEKKQEMAEEEMWWLRG
jgi:hypothetical protein